MTEQEFRTEYRKLQQARSAIDENDPATIAKQDDLRNQFYKLSDLAQAAGIAVTKIESEMNEEYGVASF
jgi:hypothetical protein